MARSRHLSISLLFLGLSLLGPSPGPAQEILPQDFAGIFGRSIGPAGMSGRISAIDVVEADPNTIYVGAATGGLWKSENGGQSWAPLFDGQRVLGIGAVAVFQPNPDIVWVGTGEGNPRNSAGVGAGLYKSMDGGITWILQGLEQSERIHRIVVHPSDPDIVYVGSMGPAWSDGEERGVFRTRDGGSSWERVLFQNERSGVADLVMDPSNPDRLLAAMWEFRRWPWFFKSGGAGSGLFLTQDGGDSWTRLTEEDGLPGGELGRIGLAFAESDPDVAYALVEAERSVLARSQDGGRSWRTVNDDAGVANRPFYYADIFVDPENELRVFNLHSRVMRSEDGGVSFEEISQGVHSDFHALWIDPNDSRFMVLGSDGGVYITRDRGKNWRMVDNLPVGQFYHVSVDQEIPFNVYGGMQDNGSWRGPSDLWENGGIRNYHWEEVGFGDGFATLMDPHDPNLGYAMSQGGGLIRFDLRTGERKGIKPWAPDGVDLRFNWNAAIALDPFNPGTLFYGSQFLHRSTSRGLSWEIISPDLTTNDPEKQNQDRSGGITRDATGAENHTTILTIAPSPVEEELVWVGTDDGLVHLTRSAGGDWEEVGHRIDDVPEGTWIPHIEASKHRGGTAYVVFEDHRRGNWTPYIFRTENYGRDWNRMADEDDLWGFVHTLEEDPVTPDLLFAGTEFGLYLSLDGGEEWLPWNHGIPPAPVRSIVVHPRDHDLVIGTHGRAAYIIDDIRPLRALAQSPTLAEKPVYLFDPPPAYLRNIAPVDGYHFAGDAMFQGETRPHGAMLTYWLSSGEEGARATIEILDSEERVLRRLDGPAVRGLNRISWDLREDLPESPLPSAGSGRRFRLEGPEVLPGRYRVRVTAEGSTSGATVEVLPDPRIEISMEDRVRKGQAVRSALGLMISTQALQVRAQEITGALDRVQAAVAGLPDSDAERVVVALQEVRSGLTDLEESVGRMRPVQRTLSSMGSTRDAPTESERIALSRMEEAVEAAITQINSLIVTRLAALREVVADTDLEPLPEFRVVVREGGG